MRHWARDPALRSWPVLLLIALVCVPPIALVLLNHATESTIHAIAWIFAAYFAVAWMWRRNWQSQAPRDYLFLGAVSGLVFGAAEAVHYFIGVLGSLSGSVNGIVLQDLTIQYIWRFLTDPVDHACWAGISGYFIGLAITGPSRKYSLALIGIGIAAVLHGLNDWDPINSHPAWILITLISVLLFLGYARAGALLPHAFAAQTPVPGAHPAPSHPAPAYPAPSHPAPAHAGAAHSAATQPTVATPVTAPARPVPPKPWWEQ